VLLRAGPILLLGALLFVVQYLIRGRAGGLRAEELG